MKNFVAIILSLIFVCTLAACASKENLEDGPKASAIQELIEYNFSTNAVKNDNYVGCEADEVNNVVVVWLKDPSKERQEEFIHGVFSVSTGSTYIRYLKEHEMLVFKAAD